MLEGSTSVEDKPQPPLRKLRSFSGGQLDPPDVLPVVFMKDCLRCRVLERSRGDAGCQATHKKKNKKKTQKKNNKAGAVAGSQLATLEEVVEQRTLPKNADYRGQHLPPPPRIPNTPRSSFNDRLIKRNRSLFFSCRHQDLSCLLSVHLSITSPELTHEKWVLGDSISKHNHLVKYF